MRVIMAPCTKEKQSLEPWILEDLGAGYVLLDIKEEISKKQEGYLEPDFEMQLGEEQIEALGLLNVAPIIFATIGVRQISSKVSSYYEMKMGRWQNKEALLKEGTIWISCYSEQSFFASELIKTIRLLIEQAKALKKIAVIYLDSKPKESYFTCRSLTYKCINELLVGEKHIVLQIMRDEDIGACYLPSEKNFEPYENHFIYDKSYNKLMTKAIKKLTKKRTLVTQESLYQDLFYEQIPMSEKLYLPLQNNFKNKSSEQVGLNTILLGQDFYAIYDTKANIEQQRNDLKDYVMPQWTLPLVAQIPIHKSNDLYINKNTDVTNAFKYRGEGVYIGIVSVEGVDWEEPLLRTSQGKTRISCIWEQEQADKGIYYTAATINTALEAEKILSDSRSEATFLLGLAGGKQGYYEAPASKAEFLVAKIKPATRNVQQLYGGEPHPLVALVPDVLIGAYKLMELAMLNQKPLVLYLPYHYLLEGIEGVNKYDRIFNELSHQPGLTIIMPVGEEADKKHRGLIEEGSSKEVRIQTKKEKQNIVGMICSEKAEVFQASLQLLGNETQRICIEEQGIYQTTAGKVESSGLKWDYHSGQIVIRFRIEQHAQSTWQLYLSTEDNEELRLSVSLCEQPVNPEATLSSWTALNTANPAPAKWGTMGVGSFDTKALVVRGGSGRAKHTNQTGLSCVAEGRASIRLKEQNEILCLEGTAIAASLVTGVVATLYSKWQQEKGKAYPNTKMMQRWIERQLTHLPNQTYPHFSQGSGILDLKKLEATLIAPLE